MPKAVVRDERQPGHFWADNEIYDVYASRIGLDGMAVYVALCRYANKESQAFPSIGTLAKQYDASPHTIRKALQKLKDAGLISITERPRGSDHNQVALSNVYTLLKVEKQKGTALDAVPHETNHGTAPDAEGTAPHAGGVLRQMQSNNTHINNTHLTNGGTRESEARDAAAVLLDAGFNQPQVDKALQAIPDLTIADVDAWIAWIPTSDKDNPIGFMAWALANRRRHPDPPLKNGKARQNGKTNGRGPPQPDLHEARDEHGELYLALPDGTRWEPEE